MLYRASTKQRHCLIDESDWNGRIVTFSLASQNISRAPASHNTARLIFLERKTLNSIPMLWLAELLRFAVQSDPFKILVDFPFCVLIPDKNVDLEKNRLTGDHYRIGQHSVICHVGLLSISTTKLSTHTSSTFVNFHQWIDSSTARFSASRTRFSRFFWTFRGRDVSIFSASFTIRARNIWSDDDVQFPWYTYWFKHPRNHRWASTNRRSGVHLTCHRGHPRGRFSQQICCGAIVRSRQKIFMLFRRLMSARKQQ